MMADDTSSAPPSNTARKTRVAFLFGGRSGEHSVSAATAAGVMGAIDRDKYEVVPVGITHEGQWVLASGETAELVLNASHTPEITSGSGRELAGLSDLEDIDVVFPLLHGPYGEDGSVQGMLELADVRYVGAGILASAVGMDKHYMKIVFEGHGLPVGPHVTVTSADWQRRRTEVMERVAGLKFPLFVKPARAGSSLGVTRVDAFEELEDAVEAARFHDPKVLIEQGIDGREIECAVLGGRDGGPPRASSPGEIVVDHDSHEFYDFDAKYLEEGPVRLDTPADLPEEIADKVRDVAVRAFEAIGAEGLSRVDVFVTPEDDVIVNEINTMPGFTPVSMYSKMWEASGLPYTDLIDELIQLALERPVGLR